MVLWVLSGCSIRALWVFSECSLRNDKKWQVSKTGSEINLNYRRLHRTQCASQSCRLEQKQKHLNLAKEDKYIKPICSRGKGSKRPCRETRPRGGSSSKQPTPLSSFCFSSQTTGSPLPSNSLFLHLPQSSPPSPSCPSCPSSPRSIQTLLPPPSLLVDKVDKVISERKVASATETSFRGSQARMAVLMAKLIAQDGRPRNKDG